MPWSWSNFPSSRGSRLNLLGWINGTGRGASSTRPAPLHDALSRSRSRRAPADGAAWNWRGSGTRRAEASSAGRLAGARCFQARADGEPPRRAPPAPLWREFLFIFRPAPPLFRLAAVLSQRALRSGASLWDRRRASRHVARAGTAASIKRPSGLAHPPARCVFGVGLEHNRPRRRPAGPRRRSASAPRESGSGRKCCLCVCVVRRELLPWIRSR